MTTITDPARRGLINELAFFLFCQSIKAGQIWRTSQLDDEQISTAIASFFSNQKERRVSEYFTAQSVSANELEDIKEQHNRMMMLFTLHEHSLHPEPAFAGCGLIDSCKGDLVADTTLYEVKAGDRLFRSIDIRQLITYSALNHISKQYTIDTVGLFNPRIGISTILPLDELCIEVSGRRSIELLSDIASIISSGEVSR